MNNDLSMTATIISVISVLVSVISVYDAQYNNKQGIERDKLKESILAVNIFIQCLENYKRKMTKNREDENKTYKYAFIFLSFVDRWSLLYVNSKLVDNNLIKQALNTKIQKINNDFKSVIKYYRKYDSGYMDNYIEMLKNLNYNISEGRY